MSSRSDRKPRNLAGEWEAQLRALLRPPGRGPREQEEHRAQEALELLALGLSSAEAAQLLGMRLRRFELLIAGETIPELEPEELQTSVARTLHRRRLREGRRADQA
jgi:hypothetical protein